MDHPIIVKPLATPPRSNTADYPLLTQLPIPLPSDSVQNRGAFVPHKVFNKLSNAFQHLKSSMQANNTPTLGNAETTHTIDRAGGIGPAAPVLAEPVFSQGKNKIFHFAKGK